MKRRVLCAFALIFWLLASCTFLSLRVEELMVPIVTVTEPVKPPGGGDDRLPLDCLFEDELGTHLYSVYEGSGWEKGVRAGLVEPGMYEILPEYIKMGWGKIIRYATKTPRVGAPVNVVQKQEIRDDFWLAVSADGKALPAFARPDESVRIVARTDTALLLSAEDLPQPFMEKRAQSLAPIQPAEDDFTPWTDENGEIDWEAVDWEALEAARPKTPSFYSLNDLGQWAAQLPKLGLLGAMLLDAVILWAFTCALARNARRNRLPILLNAGLGLLVLGLLPLLLHAVALPSSLLPRDNILEFSHYRAEFAAVFPALRSFAANGEQIAAQALRQARGELICGLAVFVLCLLPAVLLGFFERRLVSGRSAGGGHFLR